jgi:pyrroline-5-carboxylate reductase
MSVLQSSTIGFIGAGVMGSAMIGGLLAKNLIPKENIIAADPHAEQGAKLVQKYGIRYTPDNLEAAREADILVVAVKPQAIEKVMAPLRGRVDHAGLVLSIVASIKVKTLVGSLLNSRVVRSMPNTPAQIGEGMTVWCAAPEVMEQQREQAAALLGALGEQLYVEDERLLDMATALNGSGPGFVFLFMEAMIDAGVRMGFTHRDATKLVLQTLKGSINFALESGEHPAILRNQVTSPGGTTAAGLYELEKSNIRTAVAEGIWAAYQRAVQLGKAADEK